MSKHTLTNRSPVLSQKQRARFESKIDVASSLHGCHLWKGKLNAEGRGRFSANGLTDYAYRWAVVFAGTMLRQGDVVDHLCNNPTCVRLSHLRVTDHEGNMKHMVETGNHGSAKLQPDEVREIRRRLRRPAKDRPTQRELAQEFGVSRSMISRISTRKSWSTV